MVYQPSLRDTLKTFLRRKTLFMVVCGAVCLGGGAYLLLKQPLYLSAASLVLHFDNEAVPDIDRINTPSQLQGSNEHREILYSDADILHSPELIRHAIDKIGLTRLYPDIATSPRSDARKQDMAVQAFMSDLVVEVGLQSDALNLSFLNPNPTVARDAMQELLNAFYAQEASVYANPQLQFAADEAGSAKTKLTAEQDALASFKSGHQIADLPQQVSQLLLSRTDVESRLRNAQGHMLEAQQRQDALKQLLATIPAVTSCPAPIALTVRCSISWMRRSPRFRTRPRRVPAKRAAATRASRTWCIRASGPTMCVPPPRPPARSSRWTCWDSS
jgi:uncharacterized protein involved in exopolysaccharide biosynthesis